MRDPFQDAYAMPSAKRKRKQSLPTKPKGSQKKVKPAPRKSTGGVVGVPAVYKMPKKRTAKKV